MNFNLAILIKIIGYKSKEKNSIYVSGLKCNGKRKKVLQVGFFFILGFHNLYRRISLMLF